MITLKMKDHDNDHYETLAVILPVAVTIFAIIIMYTLYKLYF
jgi:hypothetical protein